MLGFIGLWRVLYPNPGDMGILFFALLLGLAVLGEVVEYVTQGWGSKKYGSSTSGMWAGLIGAMVGALAGLPLLLGLGAFIGALVGAWGGCYLMERYRGRDDAEARRAAQGGFGRPFSGNCGQVRHWGRYAWVDLQGYFYDSGHAVGRHPVGCFQLPFGTIGGRLLQPCNVTGLFPDRSISGSGLLQRNT